MKLVALSGLFMSLAAIGSEYPIVKVLAWVGVVTNAVLVVASTFSLKDDE